MIKAQNIRSRNDTQLAVLQTLENLQKNQWQKSNRWMKLFDFRLDINLVGTKVCYNLETWQKQNIPSINNLSFYSKVGTAIQVSFKRHYWQVAITCFDLLWYACTAQKYGARESMAAAKIDWSLEKMKDSFGSSSRDVFPSPDSASQIWRRFLRSSGKKQKSTF